LPENIAMTMKKRKGTTLIEIAAAVLIAAMTTVAIFSVMLSTSVSNVKADKKEVATMVLKMAKERLNSYVTSDTGAFLTNKPGTNWRLPGDSNPWALAGQNSAPGLEHDITSWVNGSASFKLLQGTGASFKYYVENVQNANCGLCKNASCTMPGDDYRACKKVTFKLVFPD